MVSISGFGIRVILFSKNKKMYILTPIAHAYVFVASKFIEFSHAIQVSCYQVKINYPNSKKFYA